MMIFHSSVCLPEGNINGNINVIVMKCASSLLQTVDARTHDLAGIESWSESSSS